jgi:murein DD-endopeptidase MepM/ murein hydrolase activator NlpD
MATVTAAIATWAVAPAAADTWSWPVRGDVLTDFVDAGGRYADGQHRGIDVAAAVGGPVTAAVAGHVRFAGRVGSSGVTVSVRTTDGRFDTSYLHLSTVSVRAGQTVATGEQVGAAGTSGRPSTTAPHLHFGIRDAGTRRYRDPLAFLPPLPGLRELPRGTPIPVRGPLRVGPAPQPVRPHRFPVVVHPPSPAAAPSRVGWAIACAALICAAALLSLRSSIGARAVLRHHTDLLRQR